MQLSEDWNAGQTYNIMRTFAVCGNMVVVPVTSRARERRVSLGRRVAFRAIVVRLRHVVSCGNDNPRGSSISFQSCTLHWVFGLLI